MQKYISDIIKIRGYIPLEEFISLSLCHHKHGYYAKENPIMKDFITSPEISNAFGIIFASYIIDNIIQRPLHTPTRSDNATPVQFRPPNRTTWTKMFNAFTKLRISSEYKFSGVDLRIVSYGRPNSEIINCMENEGGCGISALYAMNNIIIYFFICVMSS